MVMLNEPFKQDKNGIWYVRSNEVNIKPFSFDEGNGYSYSRRRAMFYHIDGIDNYIIKDSTDRPIILNEMRVKRIIKNLVVRQNNILNVEFPVGYYLDKNHITGTIVPYYQNAISLQKFFHIHKFEDLINYYHHDDDKVQNVISLCLDILDLIKSMYDNGVIYMDIHSGNFILHENKVKVIDFEPGFVFFKDKKRKNYERIIRNYALLVDTIFRKLGFENVLFYGDDTFCDTEYRVKCLAKVLGR